MRSLAITGFVFLFAHVVALGQYTGGPDDGATASVLHNTRLDGIITDIVYAGGEGDGHARKAHEAFLNAAMPSGMYAGGFDDGAGYGLADQFLDDSVTTGLFTGGTGDGHDNATMQGYFDQPIGDIYAGGPGDGFAEDYLQDWMNPTTTAIFAGGDGDGHDRAAYQNYLDLGEATLFAGGFDDGFDAHAQLLSLPAILCNSNNRTYVDISIQGPTNGGSWQQAFPSLHLAMINAENCPVDEIWVREGIYRTTTLSSRAVSYTPPGGVSIYGGFNGTEITLNQRDWEAYLTILSGEIGDLNSSSDNAYHVLDYSNTQGTSLLDGFIVEEGNATQQNPDKGRGAGVYNQAAVETQDIHLSNLTIRDCSAIQEGSALYQEGTSATITLKNIHILNNTSPLGRAIFNSDGAKLVVGEGVVVE